MMIISSMYPGYLQIFQKDNPESSKLSYSEYHDALFAESTEFVVSYTKAFRKENFEVFPVIANDEHLQRKWLKERKIVSIKNVLLLQIAEYQPDILWIEDLRFINLDTLKSLRQNYKCIKLMVAYHCAPCNSLVINKLKTMDFVITCTPGLKSDLECNGIRSYLVYHGFDTDILTSISKIDNDELFDVIFSGSLFHGSGYHNERILLIEYLLKRKINLSLFVNLESSSKIIARKILYHISNDLKLVGIKNPEKWFRYFEFGKTPAKFYSNNLMAKRKMPKFGLEMYKLLSNSRIVLNNHGEVAGNYAGNIRLFETTGVGSCLLTESRANMKDLFEVGKEVITYDSPADCVDKLNWLMNNETERKRIAEAGQKRTLHSHTIKDRASSISDIIRNELKISG